MTRCRSSGLTSAVRNQCSAWTTRMAGRPDQKNVLGAVGRKVMVCFPMWDVGGAHARVDMHHVLARDGFAEPEIWNGALMLRWRFALSRQRTSRHDTIGTFRRRFLNKSRRCLWVCGGAGPGARDGGAASWAR
jgi:hypothetical protein